MIEVEEIFFEDEGFVPSWEEEMITVSLKDLIAKEKYDTSNQNPYLHSTTS